MQKAALQSSICPDVEAGDVADEISDQTKLFGTRLEWLYPLEGDGGMSAMLAPLFSVALFRRSPPREAD